MQVQSSPLIQDLDALKQHIKEIAHSVSRFQIGDDFLSPKYRFLTQGVLWELRQMTERLDVLSEHEQRLNDKISGSPHTNEKKENNLIAYP